MGLHRTIDTQNSRLQRLLRRQLGLRVGDPAGRAIRARGLLPEPVKRDVRTVSEAARLSGNPRIAPQIDSAQVQAAYRRAVAYLHGPELAEQRRGRLLGILAGLLVNVTLVVVLLVAVLAWRGFL